MFYGMLISQFVYPFIISLHFGYLNIFDFVNNSVVNVGMQTSLHDPAFSIFGFIPRSGISESHSNYIFNFEDNCYTIGHFYTFFYLFLEKCCETGIINTKTQRR